MKFWWLYGFGQNSSWDITKYYITPFRKLLWSYHLSKTWVLMVSLKHYIKSKCRYQVGDYRIRMAIPNITVHSLCCNVPWATGFKCKMSDDKKSLYHSGCGVIISEKLDLIVEHLRVNIRHHCLCSESSDFTKAKSYNTVGGVHIQDSELGDHLMTSSNGNIFRVLLLNNASDGRGPCGSGTITYHIYVRCEDVIIFVLLRLYDQFLTDTRN